MVFMQSGERVKHQPLFMEFTATLLDIPACFSGYVSSSGGTGFLLGTTAGTKMSFARASMVIA
jgi:hypothetical protein